VSILNYLLCSQSWCYLFTIETIFFSDSFYVFLSPKPIQSKKSEAQLAEEAFQREEKRNAAAAAELKEKSKPKGGTGTKYGVKVGAPPKRIEQMEDFVPFRESVLTWILV
jgi:hypothetical protein